MSTDRHRGIGPSVSAGNMTTDPVEFAVRAPRASAARSSLAGHADGVHADFTAGPA